MKKRKTFAAMTAFLTALTCIPCQFAAVPTTAATSLKYEFEDGEFFDCENNQGIAWEQIDEAADGKPCDMTGWSGDGYAYIDDKDSAITLTVDVPADGFYTLKINYLQCLGIPHKIQYLYINGESQGEVNFPFNGRDGWTLMEAGYAHLNKGKNEIKIVSYWGYTFLDYLLIEDAPAYISKLNPTSSLCNPNASQAAKNVYDYLCSVYGEHILAGQQEYCGSHCYNKNAYETTGQPINYFESNEEEFEYLLKNTGKEPAVRGIDFLFYNNTEPYFDDAPERAIAWYKEKGGIPTVTFHWNVPLEEGSTHGAFYVESTGNTPFTTFSITNALKEDTWEHEILMKDLDLLAQQFKKLADADVPVIFRPLHEAEGGWFWWGAEGAEPCKELYHLMWNLFTKEYGLNNIIWEWTSSSYITGAEWYPGDEYVDLIGCDKYNAVNYQPNESANAATFYTLVASTNGQKMAALSECDTVPSLKNLQEAAAGWLYFCPWYKNYLTDLNDKETLKELYTSDYCITLDELPDWDNYKAGSTPASTTAAKTTTTSSATTAKKTSGVSLLGDVDENGEVNVNDVILLSRYVAEDKVTVTETGIANADCTFDEKVAADDIVRIIEYVAMLLTKEQFESGK